jgi:LysR family nitrogen assimilation transcriptional regulator
MDMQLRHLRYFVNIVDAGSFSRAATTIHVAQPALSQQMADLEAELGVNLLHRSVRGIRPTVAGQTLYHEAISILRQMQQLPAKVRFTGGEIEGAVGLGMSSTLAAYLGGPFLESCRIAFPKIVVRLIAADSLTTKSRIEAQSLDIGVVFEDGVGPGFVRRPLFRQRLFLIRRGPAEDGDTSIPIEELASRPLVLPVLPNVTRIALDRAFAEAGLVSHVVAEADVLSSMLSAVRIGIGDMVIPKGNLSDLPGYAALVPLLIEPPIYLTAYLVSSAGTPLSPVGDAVARLFVSFAADRFFESLPAGAEWIGDQVCHSKQI